MRVAVEWMCHPEKMMQRLVVSQVKSICNASVMVKKQFTFSSPAYAHLAFRAHVHAAMSMVHVAVIHLACCLQLSAFVRYAMRNAKARGE